MTTQTTTQTTTPERESDGRFAVSTYIPTDTPKGRKISKKAFNRFQKLDKAFSAARADLDADWML